MARGGHGGPAPLGSVAQALRRVGRGAGRPAYMERGAKGGLEL